MQSMAGEVSIPRSIPGLVTKNMLVMTFLEGTPITRLQVCKHLLIDRYCTVSEIDWQDQI